jgi:prepilin-type N-terminal cleavage/methylation domain-containing protein
MILPSGVRRRRTARGGTLIEVLIAMAMLALLMVGVLQLFSLSLLTDSGSAARSDMTLKAQQVAENLRYLHFLRSQGGAFPNGTGLPASPSNGLTTDLPWDGTESTWAYWGPAGANVFEQAEPPYRISYTYSASTTPNYWFVTVSVTSEAAPAGLSYIGPSARAKRVDYVCQVPQ